VLLIYLRGISLSVNLLGALIRVRRVITGHYNHL
jgi:hypothetical protein